MTTKPVPQADTRDGIFNFLDAATVPSLFRNGKVLTRRNIDGSDADTIGVTMYPQTKPVRNARTLERADRKDLRRNGFELLDAPLPNEDLDFFEQTSVVESYYPQCEQLVEEKTGGTAWAFDHNVRSAEGKSKVQRIGNGQEVQGPAKIVHGDYTLTSAPQRLRDLAQPPNINDTYRSRISAGESLISAAGANRVLGTTGRFAIINVWRNISRQPVYTNPLALCDSQTVDPNDLVTFEIHYHDRIGENYFAKHNERQTFYFYPEMQRSEALLIKQWDSQGQLAKTNGMAADSELPEEPCTFSFHSAFDDPTVGPDAPDRLSIEVRCMVLY